MTTMCCACNKVEQEGQWRIRHRLAEEERVTHGYCPRCFTKVMAAVNDFIREKTGCTVHAVNWSKLLGSCTQCA